MFRQCVCSLLLLTLVSGVAVEGAQAASSPTTMRTHGGQARTENSSGGCTRRQLDQTRRPFCNRLRRDAGAAGSHRARPNNRSQAAWTYTDPPTALGDPPPLPDRMYTFRCDRRYLRAARQDGATNSRQYRHCKAKIQRERRGYWASYLTTAYCDTGYTASGTWTKWGTVAATLPFGTRVYVPGYGNGTVLDRGGAVGPGHVDLYMPNCGQADNWGVRREKIKIFTN